MGQTCDMYSTEKTVFDNTKTKPTDSLLYYLEVVLGQTLRVGFGMKFLSHFLCLMPILEFGTGAKIIAPQLVNASDEQINDPFFRFTRLVSSLTGLFGAICLCLFSFTISDDAGWARGFSAGSKLFRTGALFDLLGSILNSVFSLYMFNQYSED